MEFSFLNNLQAVDDSRIEEYERKREEELKAEKLAVLERAYRTESGVPSRYLQESLETYCPEKENEKVFNWFCQFVQSVEKGENKKNLLFLNGSYGTGKTHLGCGLIRKIGGYIITSMELCITYDSCRDFNAKMTRIEFLKNLCKKNVLVIDEVGKGIRSIEEQILPYIVNEFYGSGRLLVFLGNIGKSDFERIISDAGADRFNESGVVLTLIGQSKRGKK